MCVVGVAGGRIGSAIRHFSLSCLQFAPCALWPLGVPPPQDTRQCSGLCFRRHGCALLSCSAVPGGSLTSPMTTVGFFCRVGDVSGFPQSTVPRFTVALHCGSGCAAPRLLCKPTSEHMLFVVQLLMWEWGRGFGKVPSGGNPVWLLRTSAPQYCTALAHGYCPPPPTCP